MNASSSPTDERIAHEHGAAAVEFAIWLPLLVLLLTAGAFAATTAVAYADLEQIAGATARYATRAAVDPERQGPYRWRPTAGEVEAYARRLARDDVLEVTVSPDPVSAFPGDAVRVTLVMRAPLGGAGAAANGIVNGFAGLFGADPPFPGGEVRLRSTVVMREE